jgi:hypothetical protein
MIKSLMVLMIKSKINMKIKLKKKSMHNFARIFFLISGKN